jgi:hypothetical protein
MSEPPSDWLEEAVAIAILSLIGIVWTIVLGWLAFDIIVDALKP